MKPKIASVTFPTYVNLLDRAEIDSMFKHNARSYATDHRELRQEPNESSVLTRALNRCVSK